MSDAERQVDELDYYTDLTVGEILRRTRMHYGQTLPQIESTLRIRATQLEAIENGQHDQLPGRVYAIGFVRSYSEYLGLDGDKMVRLFKSQSVGRSTKPELHFPVAASESKAPNSYIIFGSLIGAIGLITIWSIFYAPKNQVEEIPPVSVLQSEGIGPRMTDPVIVEGQTALPATDLLENIVTQETEEPEIPNQIVLNITEKSWVEIRNGEGAVVLRQILNPGDQYVIPPEEKGFQLSTGNAGGIEITVGNQKLPPLGQKAEVRRNIALNVDDLLTQE